MSDLNQQDEPQPAGEISVQTPVVANEIIEKSENKKSSMPMLGISRFVEVFRQYGISISVNLAILGAVCFLFFLQRDWLKGESKDIGRIVEEKVMESIKKNLSADEGVSHLAGQGMHSDAKLSKQIDGGGALDLKGKSDVTKIDNSKYVIEANRLYEQGNYESAAAFYEKGLDKSIPFVNEDFVMYRLGNCYLMSEKYEEALKVFQTLHSDYVHSPYQFKSRLKVGECYAGMGEYKKARKTLYSVVAQEGKCSTDDDKRAVVESYFKIAEYYMQEAERLRKVAMGETSSSDRPRVLK